MTDLLLVCPICGSTSFEPLDSAKLVYGCSKCTLGILRCPPADPLGLYERKNYDEERQSLPSGANVSVWQRFHHDSAVASARFQQLGHVLPRPEGKGATAWTDVGCGNAAFLVAARKAGYKVRGVELSAEFCKEITANTGVRTLTTVDFVANSGSYPSAVLSLFDVLEHLLDPIGLLKLMLEGLQKDGVLVLEVPDLAQHQGPLENYRHYKPTQHFFQFSSTSLETMRAQHFPTYELVHSAAPVEQKLQVVWKKKR